MSEPANPFPPDDELRAPAPLAGDLKSIYGQPVRVPGRVDAAILNLARARMAGVRRRRRIGLWIGGVAAAAALVLVSLRVGSIFMQSAPQSQTQVAVYDAADLNHDGRVDILDAFYLAREIKAGHALRPEWDINGDGVVDQKDVDAIAARAVSLQNLGSHQ